MNRRSAKLNATKTPRHEDAQSIVLQFSNLKLRAFEPLWQKGLFEVDSMLSILKPGIENQFIFYKFVKNDTMDNLVIENKGDQIILRLNKKGFDDNYLISLVKRLQVESLAQKSGFSTAILSVAEQINLDWWNENGEKFRDGVKK